MRKPLYLTFLWHMHQPYYKNVETGKFILPWVRMHAVKDYYDMLSILDGYPKIKQNFNLVPSLLLQIEDYLGGATDIFQDMSLKRPSDLNVDERVFIIYNFFMANWDTMIFPYRRYSYLLKKRGEASHPDEIRKVHTLFTDEEIRDLQAWFNLTWIDTEFLMMFPELGRLKDKGENFTEEEKNYIVNSHLEIMKLVIPKYREAQERGQIEVSATPFFHPILPLVYNTDTARQCMPACPLDFNFSRPEDANNQIRMSVEFFKSRFGREPMGMWPSEGSVSRDVMGLLAKNGIKWAATDEEILRESLALSGMKPGREDIYRPYTVKTPEGDVDMVFRNHYLSDLVGFNYQSWNPREAAHHFIKELYNIKNSLDDKAYCVNVILDGENAWEYYPNDGKDFLNALYKALSENPDFETITIGELMKKGLEKPVLEKLYPGSWINHDFYIWIGHEDDRKSWKLLKRVRDDLERWHKENEGLSEKYNKAMQSIYAAEGSDWNWWYGDDHSSKNDAEFDNLYRLHLMNVYTSIGEKVPDEIFIPISKVTATFETAPVRFITPVIDGRDTHFYEWKGCGLYDTTKEGGAMQKVSKLIRRLLYGFDEYNFYFRMDCEAPFSSLPVESVEARFTDGTSTAATKFDITTGTIETSGMDTAGVEFKQAEIFEAKLPFKSMGKLIDTKEVKAMFFINIMSKDTEKIPEKGIIRVQVPDEEFELYNWKA
ncbi:MAG: glycoside hydrolase [Spirochaetia bacterium]|nr:glycoside hydrolase [Spirochaetia bacterium]